MVKRRENREIGIFSLCLPVDISPVTGRCQQCWSHAKTQRRKVRTKCSLSPHFILRLAPLREVKSSNRRTLESGQSGMLSYWLPVSLTPFHHPSFALPALAFSQPPQKSGQGKQWMSNPRYRPVIVLPTSRQEPRGCYRPIEIDRSPDMIGSRRQTLLISCLGKADTTGTTAP
jgi:hypothetical protein